jgi:protein tyrosine phosphatase (PTP) superfamily phosphohydrolase (DUF442 family)
MLTRRATLALIYSLTLIVTCGAGPIPHADAPLAQSAAPQVPFGDQGADLAVNYNRLRPHIATAGLLKDGAIPKLKAMGFTSIVDLRGPDEGTASEKEAVESAGLRYFNIPVTNRMLPTDLQIAEFGRIVEDARNAPILIHSTSVNQVGAMWTMYRILEGVPPEIAFEEGRTIGLQPDREAEIRTWLAVRTPTK